MQHTIPFQFREREAAILVEYAPNTGIAASGFDLLPDLPFPAEKCLGYPTVHAKVDAQNLNGYRRYCGWIQLLRRIEVADGEQSETYQLDVTEDMRAIGLPYFAFGYPAQLYDAPCMNLQGSTSLHWTAYTYLVDIPTRMNGGQLSFLAGFTWGYTEDQTGVTGMLPFAALTQTDWERHLPYVKAECPILG